MGSSMSRKHRKQRPCLKRRFSAGLLHSDERDAPVPVTFEFNLHEIYDRPGLLFQVCADCGKTYYEGWHRHRMRHAASPTAAAAKASSSATADASSSVES